MKSMVNQKTSRSQGMPAQLSLSFGKPQISPPLAGRLPHGPMSKLTKKLQRMKGKEYLFGCKNYLISDFIVTEEEVLILTRGGKNLIIATGQLKETLKDFLRVDPL